jgi:hypothetical protein
MQIPYPVDKSACVICIHMIHYKCAHKMPTEQCPARLGIVCLWGKYRVCLLGIKPDQVADGLSP